MSPARPATSNSTGRGERGSATVELVILLPALFAFLFLGVQAALYFHAKSVALAAAQQGARAASTASARAPDGAPAAEAFISAAGGANVITGSNAAATRTATTVVVTVTGSSLSVIPGWTLHISQSASLPVERITTP